MKKIYKVLLLLTLAEPTTLMDATTIDLLTPNPGLGEACGYHACPKFHPDKINVHVVPSTQYDLGLFRTFYQHYTGRTQIRGYDSKINFKRTMDNVVAQLWAEPKRKFSLFDTPYFFKWWSERDETVRRMVFQLLRQGRLYFIGGGWSMSDEATTSYHAIIDHFTYSLRKINATFLECGRPLVTWQAESYGHTREFASLMAMMGFDGHFVSPISVEDELTRMTKKSLDFVWRGSDDLGQDTDIYTNKLFDGCNAPPGFCFAGLCDDPLLITSTMELSNIDDRVKVFMDSVLNRQAPYYSSRNVLVVMGERLGYYDAGVWFANIDKLIDNVKLKSAKLSANINIFYSTPACYLKAVYEANPSLSIKQDDFIPYESGKISYVVGMYTSRPTMKYMIRCGHVLLQIAKQLQVLAHLSNNDRIFEELLWITGAVQDHNIITGGSQQSVINYYKTKLFIAIQKSTVIIRDAINKLRNDHRKTQLFRCSFNESGCWNSEGQEFFIVVYNPLCWPVTKPIRIPVLNRKHLVYNHRAQPVRAVLMRIPTAVLNLPQRKHTAAHELTFMAEDLPPLGYRSYFIKSQKRTPIKQKRSIIKKLKRNKKKKYLIKQTNPLKIDEESLLDNIDYEYFDEHTKTPKHGDETGEGDDYNDIFNATDKVYGEENGDESTKTNDDDDVTQATDTKGSVFTDDFPPVPTDLSDFDDKPVNKDVSYSDRTTDSPKEESELNDPVTLPNLPYSHDFTDNSTNDFIDDVDFDDKPPNIDTKNSTGIQKGHKTVEPVRHFEAIDEVSDTLNKGKSTKHFEKSRKFGGDVPKINEDEEFSDTPKELSVGGIRNVPHHITEPNMDERTTGKQVTGIDFNDQLNKHIVKSNIHSIKPTRIPITYTYDHVESPKHVPETNTAEDTTSSIDNLDVNEKNTKKDDIDTNLGEESLKTTDVTIGISRTSTKDTSEDDEQSNIRDKQTDKAFHDTATKNPETDVIETTTKFSESAYEDEAIKNFEISDYDDEFYKKLFRAANVTSPNILNNNTKDSDMKQTIKSDRDDSGHVNLEGNRNKAKKIYTAIKNDKYSTPYDDVKREESHTAKMNQVDIDKEVITERVDTATTPETRRMEGYDGPVEDTTEESNEETGDFYAKVSEDLFIANKYIRLNLNKRREMDTLVLQNGVTINLNIEFYYYESQILTDSPKTLWDRNAGANVFKLRDGQAIPIKKNKHITIFKTDLVEEMHCQVANMASLVFRIYEDQPYLEIDWVAGPISVEDGIGKEIFIRYTTNLDNKGVFYTDSNGRQTIKRIRNRRATFTKQVLDAIAGNIYPVTSKIYIEDEEKNIRVSILNDRAQGGASLNDGQIDMFVHRRILTDDIGAGVYVNETYDDKDGIIIRGTHYLYVSKADYKPNRIFEKKFAKEIELSPQIFVSPAYPYAYYSLPIWNTHRNEFTALNNKLPLGIHILTIEEWNSDTLLMRFENYLEKTDVYREGTKKIYIQDLFVHLKIYGVQETTLAGNIWLRDYSKKYWNKRENFFKNFNEFYSNSGWSGGRLSEEEPMNVFTEVDIQLGITLKPQQIRTFVVTFSYYGLT